MIEPILAGELPEEGIPDDDVAFVEDLGRRETKTVDSRKILVLRL